MTSAALSPIRKPDSYKYVPPALKKITYNVKLEKKTKKLVQYKYIYYVQKIASDRRGLQSSVLIVFLLTEEATSAGKALGPVYLSI